MDEPNFNYVGHVVGGNVEKVQDDDTEIIYGKVKSLRDKFEHNSHFHVHGSHDNQRQSEETRVSKRNDTLRVTKRDESPLHEFNSGVTTQGGASARDELLNYKEYVHANVLHYCKSKDVEEDTCDFGTSLFEEEGLCVEVIFYKGEMFTNTISFHKTNNVSSIENYADPTLLSISDQISAYSSDSRDVGIDDSSTLSDKMGLVDEPVYQNIEEIRKFYGRNDHQTNVKIRFPKVSRESAQDESVLYERCSDDYSSKSSEIYTPSQSDEGIGNIYQIEEEEEDESVYEDISDFDSDEGEPIYENIEKRFEQMKIDELISTDKTYLKELEHVVRDYVKYFKENPNLMPFNRNNVFTNIEELYKESKLFLQDLLQCNYEVDRVALTFIDHKHLFENLYVNYIRHKHISDYYISQKYADVIQQRHEELRATQKLEICLLTPFQRLCRYKLLLDDLQKILKKSGHHSDTLSDAVDFIKLQLIKVNTFRAVDSIRHCVIDLQKVGQFLLKHNFTLKRRKHEVFLFEEVIVFTVQCQNVPDSFMYKDNLDLREVQVESPNDSTKLCLLVKGRGKDKVKYELEANSEKVKEEWKKEILKRKRLLLTNPVSATNSHIPDDVNLRKSTFYLQ